MPLDKEALQRKWWFLVLVIGGALFSKSRLLDAAGLKPTFEGIISPLALVHYSVVLGFMTAYSALVALLVLRVWPYLVGLGAGRKNSTRA